MSRVKSVTINKSTEVDRRTHTRQQIIDATRKLLAQGEAFARLSIGRIVVVAGVSRATFYLHFRTKRELVAALAQSETGAWATIAAPFLDDPRADRAVLSVVVRQLVDLWREHRAVLAGIIELAEYDDDTRAAWRDTAAEVARMVATSMRCRRPELSPAEADYRSRLLVWAGERFLHQEAGQPMPDHDRLLIESLTELFWRMVSE